MNLPSISFKLKRLAELEMPAEALRDLLRDLAVELDTEEARLSKERARKVRGSSKETARKLQGNGAEIPPLARVEDNTLPSLTSGKEESKNLPLSPSKPLSSDPDGFEEFWNVYPKRHKNFDRKAAVKAFNAALKRTDLQTLVDGARAYAADCKADNKIGTEFVKQARSWLNGDCWTEWLPKPQEQIVSGNNFYIKAGTPEGDAWDTYYKTRGKPPRRDFNGGWWYPSEFPPTEGATQ